MRRRVAATDAGVRGKSTAGNYCPPFFLSSLLRRAVQNPVQEQVVVAAAGTSRRQGVIEPKLGVAAVMMPGRLAQQRAGDDIGEVDTAANFGIKPGIVGGIHDTIAIAVIVA